MPTHEMSAWALTANTKLKFLLESEELHEDTRADVEATRKELLRAVLGIKTTKEPPMAMLHPEPYPLSPLSWGGDWRTSAHELEFDALVKAAEQVDTTRTLVGSIINFSVADGFAHYLVTKDSPLTLQHVPYGDGYRVAPYTIRGLRKADVLAMVQRRRAWS